MKDKQTGFRTNVRANNKLNTIFDNIFDSKTRHQAQRRQLTPLLLVTALFGLLSLISSSSWAIANAQLDRQLISLGDTFTLQVSSDQSSFFGSTPDFSALDKDFTVLSRNSSFRTSLGGGQSSSTKEWILVLEPKRTGTFTIPAFDVYGEQTKPLEITVGRQVKRPQGKNSNRQVFTEAEITPLSPYVQAQFIYTLRFYASISVSNLALTPLEIDNAFIEDMGNTQFRTNVNGKQYIVYEVKYAIFPKQAGELVIPSQRITAIKGRRRGFFLDPLGGSNSQRVNLNTESKTITVKEVPASAGTGFWLPASEFSISEQWSQPLNEVKVGDSLTRTITLKAKGLTGEQLPPMELPKHDGLKFYPDQGEVDKQILSDGITGTRKDSYALIATKPGRYQLPAVTVQWWDVEDEQLKQATLPPQTVVVTGSAAQDNQTPITGGNAVDFSKPAATPQTPAKVVTRVDAGFWPYISGALLVAWLITLALWWQARRKPAPANTPTAQNVIPLNAQQALQQLKQAVQQQDNHAARQALLAWARAYWPKAGIHALANISTQLSGHPQQATLAQELKQLDKALYAPDEQGSWNGSALLNVIEALSEQANQNDGQLTRLYG